MEAKHSYITITRQEWNYFNGNCDKDNLVKTFLEVVSTEVGT